MFKTRLLSGIVLVAVALLTIISGGYVLFFTLLGISLIGMQELYKVMKVREDHFNALEIAGYLGAVIYYVLMSLDFEKYGMMGVIISFMMFMFVYVFTYPKFKADQVMPAFFGVVYVAVMLSFIYLTRNLPDGKFLVWLIFLCSWGCDTCAYCVGMLIGRHKMAPILSPKKSVEGGVGGVAGAALLGAIYAAATGGKIAEYALICAVGALISMVGDLAASAIKRNQGIKDYGKLIPGHGGILDRFDSVIFTAPAIYFLDIEVLGISAGRNVKMLEEQAREFHPQLIAVWDENAAKDLAVRLADMDVKIVSGMEGLLELARMPQTDILVTAVVGMIGIRPTMEGIKAGKDIALANKETLVTAGHLIIPMAKEHGVQILPVDSEHSAIFQALHGEKRAQVEKLLITASGGPFRGRKREELEHVTLADTLKHPNWVMGQKITVDSATLVNKGLEVMEARWLFDVDLDHIQVVVQPKSIIHSMVEFKDGAVMAQLGTPDMRLPIQYALYYPERRYLDGERLDFHKLKEITFEDPDMDTFLGLPMAMDAARKEGSMPTVFNAANELAVKKFLQEKIGFLDIYDIIAQSMERHTVIRNPELEEILAVEDETYKWIESRW